jgi:hypothetical protein
LQGRLHTGATTTTGPPTLTVITSLTTASYLVHAKPRQEDVALNNLERQGYTCYLPQMRIERVQRRKVETATESMFPRYLFIRRDSSDRGKSCALPWSGAPYPKSLFTEGSALSSNVDGRCELLPDGTCQQAGEDARANPGSRPTSSKRSDG